MDFLNFLTNLGIDNNSKIGIFAVLSFIFWFFVTRGGQFISKLIFAFFKREKDLEVREMNVELREYFDGKFTQVNNRFDHIQEDLTSVKLDVSILKTDVAVLKTDVAVLKNDVNSINTRVGFLENLNPFWFLVKAN
jgi:hypothetical protein